jgi:hypothetical protein
MGVTRGQVLGRAGQGRYWAGQVLGVRVTAVADAWLLEPHCLCCYSIVLRPATAYALVHLLLL